MLQQALAMDWLNFPEALYMQYPQQTPNIMIVGDSALLEKIALAYRLDLKVSRVLRRIAPLLMLLVLALHFVAWQFLVAVRVEYGYAVIGLGVLQSTEIKLMPYMSMKDEV